MTTRTSRDRSALDVVERSLRIVVVGIAAFAALCSLVVVVSMATGARPLVFRSGSMSPAIPAGSLAFTRHADAGDLAVGDVVTVKVGSERVTHRIIAVDHHGDVALLQLKGDANHAADRTIYPVREAQRTWFSVPVAGSVTAWLSRPVGGLSLAAYLLLVVLVVGRWRRALAPSATSSAAFMRRNRAVAGGTAVLTFAAGAFGSWVMPTWAYWTDDAHASSATISTGTWDVAPPASAVTNVTPLVNAAGWYNANITVSLTASDAAPSSGIAGIHYILNGGSEQVLPGSTGNVSITTEGTNTLQYWAVDNAGFSESPHHTATYKLDKTAPGVPSITSISSDSGTAGDFITNVPAQTLTGSAEANSSVVVSKGASTLCTTAANGSGVFTCAVTLAAGANVYTITATDVAGNVSSPGTRTVTLDATIATPTFTSISSDSGTAGDRITNVAAQTLTGAADAGDNVVVKKGATTLCTATANGSGVFTCAVVLATGANDYVATASDVAGNTATSATFTVTLDQTTPTPTFTSISSDSGTAGDLITNVAGQTLTGSAEPGATVVVKKGASTLCTVAANGSGVFTCAVTLVSGPNAYTATATDVASNTATSATYTVTLDQSITTPTFTSISNDSGTAGDLITNVASQTLTGSTDAGATVVVKKAASTLCTVTANASGVFTCNVVLVAGANNYTATATDVAGNTATSATYVVTLDTTAPSAPVLSSIGVDTGSSVSDRVTKTAANTLVGTGEVGSLISVTIDGGAVAGTTTVDGSGNFSFSVTLTEGSHVYAAKATDGAGNASAASNGLTVVLDTVVPAGTVTFPSSGNDFNNSSQWGTNCKNSAGTSIAGWCGTRTDALSGVASINYQISRVVTNGGATTCWNAGTSTFGSCPQVGTPAASSVANGWVVPMTYAQIGKPFSASITLTITDNAGNVGTVTVNF